MQRLLPRAAEAVDAEASAAAATVADGAAAMTEMDAAAEIAAVEEAVAATAETGIGAATGIEVRDAITTVREKIVALARSGPRKKRQRLGKRGSLGILEKIVQSRFPVRRSLRTFRRRIVGTTKK